MISKNKTKIIILIAVLFLAACGGQPATEQPELDMNAILTSSVGTFSASVFQTQTGEALSVTPSPTSTSTTQPTNTAIALSSPIATSTQGIVFNPGVSTLSLSPSPTGTQYTPTPNPSTLAFGCNNLALIRDETIPAGTVFKPEEMFTKTWKVENNGTCDWVFQFRLVFIGGNQMGGDPAGLGKVIAPKKWTQISIQLMAPKQPGSYTGTWRFGTQAGNPFGSTLTVSIVVASPTNTPAPATNTSVPPTATNTSVPPTATETPTATTAPTDTPAVTNTP